MAMMLVLLSAETRFALSPEALSRLAALGITRVSLLRDQRSLGVVVEGWAFDPSTSAEKVGAAVGARARSRKLQPLMEMAIEKEIRDEDHR